MHKITFYHLILMDYPIKIDNNNYGFSHFVFQGDAGQNRNKMVYFCP